MFSVRQKTGFLNIIYMNFVLEGVKIVGVRDKSLFPAKQRCATEGCCRLQHQQLHTMTKYVDGLHLSGRAPYNGAVR
jgi:hypothetical protein